MKRFLKLLKYWRHHQIASNEYSQTLMRFFKWQLSTRVLKYPVVVPWINGTKLIIERGMTGATMNYYCGLHEFADMGFLLHFLRSNDYFADIGANVGSYTILAAGVIGCKTISLEPIPTTFKKFENNVNVNSLHELVDAMCCAAGPTNSIPLKFTSDCDTTNRVVYEGYKGPTIDVPVRDLDSLLINKPAALWKIDVEGFESQVLSGAQKALESPSLLAVQLEGNSSFIKNNMQHHGFETYNYDPITRQLTRSVQSKSSHNWLWIRSASISEVTERCSTAKKINVGKTII